MHHLSWHGRLYGRGLVELPFRRWRIYHGVWNSAPFQSVYAQAEGRWTSLPLMPEWYAIVLTMAALALIGIAWPPLLVVAPLAAAGVALSVAMAVRAALRAQFAPGCNRRLSVRRMRLVVAWLHLIQPVARLVGRIEHGIGPWKRKPSRLLPLPLPEQNAVWTEDGRTLEDRLAEIVRVMHERGVPYRIAGVFDRFDLSLRQSLFGELRVTAMVEEHGSGRQMVRFRTRPVIFGGTLIVIAGTLTLAMLAFLDGGRVAAAALGLAAVFPAVRCWVGLSRARHDWRKVLASGSGMDARQ